MKTEIDIIKRTGGDWKAIFDMDNKESYNNEIYIVSNRNASGDDVRNNPIALLYSVSAKIDFGNARNNAAFICKAVNNYDFLRRKLESLIYVLEMERKQNGISLSDDYKTLYEESKQLLNSLND